MARSSMKLAGVAAALAMCLGSTSAIAASSASFSRAPSSISPLVALSALGSQASRAAMCGASVSSAMGAAAAQGGVVAGTPGCVLPMVDQPVAPVVQEVVPVYTPEPVAVAVVPVASPSFSFLPLLAGLAVLGGLAFLLLRDNDDDDGFNFQPISAT